MKKNKITNHLKIVFKFWRYLSQHVDTFNYLITNDITMALKIVFKMWTYKIWVISWYRLYSSI